MLRLLFSCILTPLILSTPFHLSLAEDPAGGNPGIYEDGLSSVDPAAGLNRNKDVSTLESSLCMIILLINGRIGRAIAAMSLILLGYQFFLGKAQWSLVAIICIGFGLLFGAKSVALALLPAKVYVRDYNEDKYIVKSSDELVKTSCPELK